MGHFISYNGNYLTTGRSNKAFLFHLRELKEYLMTYIAVSCFINSSYT
jgi:hypothetical protein